ncbi:hypothetical protein KIPB_014700, partial [Kipferlia bialata]
ASNSSTNGGVPSASYSSVVEAAVQHEKEERQRREKRTRKEMMACSALQRMLCPSASHPPAPESADHPSTHPASLTASTPTASEVEAIYVPAATGTSHEAPVHTSAPAIKGIPSPGTAPRACVMSAETDSSGDILPLPACAHLTVVPEEDTDLRKSGVSRAKSLSESLLVAKQPYERSPHVK